MDFPISNAQITSVLADPTRVDVTERYLAHFITAVAFCGSHYSTEWTGTEWKSSVTLFYRTELVPTGMLLVIQ